MRSALRAAAAVGLIALGGCSSPSELMIAVHTDLGVPDDIDLVKIAVFRGGREKFVDEYPNLGGEGAGARLPFTLGLVAEAPGVEVHVRASAWSKGLPRIVREAVTTIPSERVALLHLPLHFLCDGFARRVDRADLDAPLDGVENARCGEGETCVAGACVAAEVDSSTLPDYAPEDVFGGSGSQGGSACFDVARCFAAAREVSLLDAGGDCSFVRVQEPGSAAQPVNVALKTPPQSEARGICGESGCFVALDAGSEAGFEEGADGVVRLPPAVCGQVAAGKGIEVVSQPAGEGCPQKVQALPTCGPWSAAGGG
ncbi:hypothetical protein WMF18_23855 [Sorangium sp. So ce315]|uniref:hypothetical protein n=1 Tax=Sorangium sp. So ce315 TaxID=3133299 RepID=UPI003F644257